MNPEAMKEARGMRQSPGARALVCAWIIGGCVLAGGALPLLAQASFSEDFDSLDWTDPGVPGPGELVARGWIFRNQSDPPGDQGYFAGPCSLCGLAHAGPRALDVDLRSADAFGGAVSNWAILPAIPGQAAGDTLVFHARAVMSFNVPPRLEVRYSPGRGAATGSSATDTGDFTDLLLDVSPVTGPGWTRFDVPVPGDGRLALRFLARSEPIPSDGNTWLEIDTLSVGPPPVPPCNLPPVPRPGETVAWIAAASPYRICQGLSIPAGGTVRVEPGVRVDFERTAQLVVAGTLEIDANEAARVVWTAPDTGIRSLLVAGGTIDARFTEFHHTFEIGDGATVLLSDCSFASDGVLSSADIPRPHPFVTLERCKFIGSHVSLSDCLAVLRENTFADSYALLLRGFAHVTAPNTFTGQPLRISRQETIQPLLIDGVRGTGSSTAGLSLDGGTYHLGPGVELQDNLFPLELLGGLTPDSVVPVTGNTINAIDVGNAGFVGRGRWARLGLPYRITGPVTSLPGGDLTIDPGVVVEGADPDAGLWFTSTRQGVLDGLPGAPITFRGVNGRQWGGLLFHANATTGCRMEYCAVEDAEVGVVSTDNLLYVDSCIFTRNRMGANMNTSGVIRFRKTRFVSNGTGMAFPSGGRPHLNSPRAPNAFEENAFGIDAFDPLSGGDARNSWWNSASGPRAPGNPGGEGDSIAGVGAVGIEFQPFLTAPPDFTNTPPVVRMIEPGLTQRYASPDYTIPDYLLDQGTRYVLHWDVESDDGIVSQRIEFSPDGHYPDRFRVLVDAIDGDARSRVITVPDPGYAGSNQPQFLRVIAVDAAGQEGWDQAAVQVPSGRIRGDLTITTGLEGRTFLAGEAIPDVEWTGSVNFGLITPLVVLESDGAAIAGLRSQDGQGYFGSPFPFVSTDRARLALQVTNNSNDVAWFFAEGYFAIRHDPRLGFAAPVVTLLSPLGGESFAGGSTVSIEWTAEARETLRSFDVQASYDAGRTWHPIALDLPGISTSFDWRLPANAGIGDVRVRVIARDGRFQNSATDSGPFSILSGAMFHRGDPDGSGTADLTDAIFILEHLFLSGPAPGCLESADAQNDGLVDLSDAIAILLYLFSGGAPPPAPGPPPGPCGPDPDAPGSPGDLGCEAQGEC
jgi:hypothetical protein